MIRNTLIRRIQLAPIVFALGLVSGAAHAALEGRDLNGSVASFEAWYDTDRDITWLADANYAKTSGYDADGSMKWADANTWAANLSLVDAVNNITYDNWRLPSVVDTGAPGCVWAYTGTDCGWNVDTATSEMAHLFYDELGNKAYFDTSRNGPQSGWSLTPNTGPFTNLQGTAPNLQATGSYWSGTEYAPENTVVAWGFDFNYGFQDKNSKGVGQYALAVSPGDVGAVSPVPEAQTYALMLSGLGLIGWRARRRG